MRSRVRVPKPFLCWPGVCRVYDGLHVVLGHSLIGGWGHLDPENDVGLLLNKIYSYKLVQRPWSQAQL